MNHFSIKFLPEIKLDVKRTFEICFQSQSYKDSHRKSMAMDSYEKFKKFQVQFMCHATKALRCNGFVAGPNSAGSFYVLSYHTLLWKTCFKCPSREIHSPSGFDAILAYPWTVTILMENLYSIRNSSAYCFKHCIVQMTQKIMQKIAVLTMC